MRLIKYENYKLKISDEAYMIGAFRRLHDSDKTASKEMFIRYMSVIYFTYDPRSSFNYIVSEEDRLNEVLMQEGFDPEKFSPSKDFTDAVEIYKKTNITPSTALLEDTRFAVNKLRQLIRNIDFDQLDEKDKVNAIKTTTATVAMIPKLVEELVKAEKAVVKEFEEETKARGGAAKTIFDDGFKNIE